ncbi:replication restart DNA helicase PriA [Colwellia chukchiensis]|uniref:Replication restart protein PriA n=1 Tax=Colwellia chukchiensis TaxID=641665 RepID=A0A1H7RE82_9GAMM|nr:primosomal protein N' [Colwellia chukchiensis]SEL58254.1 replication restart DNA helicase PriA [Colwellia chukchiensis]
MADLANNTYVQVAIPVPMRQLFTYRVPTELTTPALRLGERVIVPFGARHVVAIVLSIDSHSEYAAEKLKSILSRVNDNFHFSPELIDFIRRCSEYYHHPIGDVFQQALPVLLRQIKQPSIDLPPVWKASDNITTAEQAASAKRSPKQAELLAIIQQRDGITWSELLTLGFNKSQLKALEKKAFIYSQASEVSRFSWQNHYLQHSNRLSLSPEQALIVATVKELANQFACHLIDGVTGSGKTEVYLQAMEQALAQDQQVLVLVPEIGLTPQTLSRFEQRFHVPISLHHSGLNDKERLQTWLAAQRGSAAIIIGTRSAVFSPLTNLGLIIVDEEHDASFKQQDSFRYHARDMAILRARQLNIPILLGSATPSFESLHNGRVGKYHYHQLRKRAGNATMAKISVIDIAQQQMQYGLSGTLKHAIVSTLARGEQALIFLNRRGYAPAINCQECHWLADCQRCNKPYTLHQSQGLLICHHCASQKRIPAQCPSCGSVRIKPLGQGTEQLEEKISELFPDYSTVRIDRDSTRKKGALAKLLTQINNKEHQLLIGTQMLAKGHHFPNVTLVAILDVDGALFSYDFRAAEHMAQLLVQVSGRAGRASKPGKVLVQTRFPEHPLLQDLVNNGYQHFATQALNERQQALLPPFSFQALFRAEANYPSYPEKFLRSLAETQCLGCQFAGPVPAAMEKKAGKYRFHLILQAKSRKQLHQAVFQLIHTSTNNEWQSKVRWSVDIDPIDLTW